MTDRNDPSGNLPAKVTLQKSDQEYLIDKGELGRRLDCSPGKVGEMMRKRKIPFIKLGHKTVRFDWRRVQEALAKFEIREVGRK